MKTLERRDYFPTLIFQGELEGSEEFNDDILEALYAARDSGATVEVSSEGRPAKWRSARNLHRNPDFDPLKKQIQAALDSIATELRYSKEHMLKISSMWFNINSAGSATRAQCRPGHLWTGCYCVQVPKGTGSMKFIDPRTINIMNPAKYDKDSKKLRECLTKVEFKPRSGHLVIFPAWLYQEIEPNLANEKGRDGDYVYISFNVDQTKK